MAIEYMYLVALSLNNTSGPLPWFVFSKRQIHLYRACLYELQGTYWSNVLRKVLHLVLDHEIHVITPPPPPPCTTHKLIHCNYMSYEDP